MLPAQRVQEPMLLLYLRTHAWQESDVGHLYRLRWEIEPCFEPSGVSHSKINEFNTGGIPLKAFRLQQVGKLRPVFAGWYWSVGGRYKAGVANQRGPQAEYRAPKQYRKGEALHYGAIALLKLSTGRSKQVLFD